MFNVIIKIHGKILSELINSQINEQIGYELEIEIFDVIGLWGEAIKGGDPRTIPWLLGAWYKWTYNKYPIIK